MLQLVPTHKFQTLFFLSDTLFIYNVKKKNKMLTNAGFSHAEANVKLCFFFLWIFFLHLNTDLFRTLTMKGMRYYSKAESLTFSYPWPIRISSMKTFFSVKVLSFWVFFGVDPRQVFFLCVSCDIFCKQVSSTSLLWVLTNYPLDTVNSCLRHHTVKMCSFQNILPEEIVTRKEIVYVTAMTIYSCSLQKSYMYKDKTKTYLSLHISSSEGLTQGKWKDFITSKRKNVIDL